jgi:putative flippase GtrA
MMLRRALSRAGAGLRSLLTSLFTTSFEILLFALTTLILAGHALLCARWIVGALGAVANFLLNRVWAFRATGAQDGARSQAFRYGTTALISVSLATALWWALKLFTGLDVRLLHITSMAVVWLVFTFPMLRGWVFSARSPASYGSKSTVPVAQVHGGLP